MSVAANPSRSLKSLRREYEANRLALEVAAQRQAIRAANLSTIQDKLESFYDPENYVDLRDYIGDSAALFRFSGAQPTRKDDREEGRNYPIFRTELELAQIRGACRVLATYNNTGVAALERLTDYVIRTGFDYQVSGVDETKNAYSIIAKKVIDQFFLENRWHNDLDRELFQRKRRDGERFLGLWHVGGGHVQSRCIEPDYVTQPALPRDIEAWLGCADEPSSWTLGVHTELGDVEEIHGYYVQWSERDTDWDYLPGGCDPLFPPHSENCWLDHAKINVDRNVKRGLSDFFCIDTFLDLGRKLLRNTGHGAALQAAIAWIKEVVPGTTQAATGAEALAKADAKFRQTKASGQLVERTVQQYQAGSILTPPAGTQYKAGPLGAGQAGQYFVGIYEAIMRYVGTRWAMREDMITGSAANNNYASILVAGDPFVLACESKQQAEAADHERILWRVLYWAWVAGRFGVARWEDVRAAIQIKVVPPQVAVRDRDKETLRYKTLSDAGIMSDQTWAAKEDLDYDQEVAGGAKPKAEGFQIPAVPTVAATPSTDETEESPQAATGDPPPAAVTNSVADPTISLNGAQITAAKDFLGDLIAGRTTAEITLGLLIAVGLQEQVARDMVRSAKSAAPPVPPQQQQQVKLTTALESIETLDQARALLSEVYP